MLYLIFMYHIHLSLRHLRRSFTNYAARKLEPLHHEDTKAKIPVVID